MSIFFFVHVNLNPIKNTKRTCLREWPSKKRLYVHEPLRLGLSGSLSFIFLRSG
jgi:hypothetical protein